MYSLSRRSWGMVGLLGLYYGRSIHGFAGAVSASVVIRFSQCRAWLVLFYFVEDKC